MRYTEKPELIRGLRIEHEDMMERLREHFRRAEMRGLLIDLLHSMTQVESHTILPLIIGDYSWGKIRAAVDLNPYLCGALLLTDVTGLLADAENAVKMAKSHQTNTETLWKAAQG